MSENKKDRDLDINKNKALAPGLGLIFGVPVGALFGIITGNDMVLFAGAGAGLGLVVGAAVFALTSKNKK